MRSPEDERRYADSLTAALSFLDAMRPAIQIARAHGWQINVGVECGDQFHRFNVSGELVTSDLEAIVAEDRRHGRV